LGVRGDTATGKIHDKIQIVKYCPGLFLYPVHIYVIAAQILKTSLRRHLAPGNYAAVHCATRAQNILNQPM